MRGKIAAKRLPISVKRAAASVNRKDKEFSGPQEGTSVRRGWTPVCGVAGHQYAGRLDTSMRRGWILVSAMAAHQCLGADITGVRRG
jgi:hypothetical protein